MRVFFVCFFFFFFFLASADWSTPHLLFSPSAQAMRKKSNKDLRHMSKMELEVRRQKAATARKVTQVRWKAGTPEGVCGALTRREHSNQDKICLVKLLESIGFRVYDGS